MSFKRAIVQHHGFSVSGTAASSPSWPVSNGGIDWLHAVISLQIHTSVQAFLARLRPRFAVQLLQGMDAV
jgi:hypothetical protein